MNRILLGATMAFAGGIVAGLKNATCEAADVLAPATGPGDPFEPVTRYRKRGSAPSPAQRLLQQQRKKRQTK